MRRIFRERCWSCFIRRWSKARGLWRHGGTGRRERGHLPKRKLFCLVLVLVCIGSAALAATVPSKTTADLSTTTKITTESGERLDSLVILPVVETEESKAQYARRLEICSSELKKLAEVVAQTGEPGWTALEGVGCEDGSIEVVFTAELLAAIQNGDALMAIASDV